MSENLNEKICIVGAGPSGMSAAWYLQKKGYTDVTVLERLDRVGGKCNTPKFDGKYYEMGAVIGLPTYYKSLALMDEAGIEYYHKEIHGKYSDGSTGKYIEYFTKEEQDQLKLQIAKLQHLIQTKYPDIKKPGHEKVHPDLADTFENFCIKNEIPLVLKLWINPYTGYGYGYFNLVSAAYVLQYLDVPTMMGFINKEFILWKEGTESIWHQLNAKLNKKVRLCTHIEKVVRNDNKVYVYTDFGKEEYDKIIFSSPLQDLKNYVDLAEEEGNLFSKITYMEFYNYACLVENPTHLSTYVPGNMIQSRAGHVVFFYDRTDEGNNVITFDILGNQGEKVTSETCRKYLEEDIELHNMHLKDIVMHKCWRYFPHINTEEMKHGWYDKVEALQGNKNTYYAGEIMSFSDMEECVSYSNYLVERFF
ncbi:FAD-dependent oxidoreductase [Clostridium hydrogenum]|uniref:FAD-dependent oxidoreductase n=1 Tax=Clostridium hydrogenum TaxID=2855764 RepID=UPI001F1D52CB|nr:FAD-dependent oxidoreductase [Clostridium hydrogenum]